MGNEKLFCKGGGCTAKLGAGILSRVLERLPKFDKDPALLIGYDSKDDAAVYVAGDARTGSSLVVNAMADALKCAAEVAGDLGL